MNASVRVNIFLHVCVFVCMCVCVACVFLYVLHVSFIAFHTKYYLLALGCEFGNYEIKCNF